MLSKAINFTNEWEKLWLLSFFLVCCYIYLIYSLAFKKSMKPCGFMSNIKIFKSLPVTEIHNFGWKIPLQDQHLGLILHALHHVEWFTQWKVAVTDYEIRAVVFLHPLCTHVNDDTSTVQWIISATLFSPPKDSCFWLQRGEIFHTRPFFWSKNADLATPNHFVNSRWFHQIVVSAKKQNKRKKP